MEARDFKDTRCLATLHEVETFLSRRFPVDGVAANSFWLSHADEYPCLLVLAKEDIASLWYTPRKDHPGFLSVGTVDTPHEGGVTIFYFDRQPQEATNESIVRFSEALRAAEDFMRSEELPSSIKWLEL